MAKEKVPHRMQHGSGAAATTTAGTAAEGIKTAFPPPDGLTPGDRVPNVQLPDPWNNPVPLYGLLPFGPCLLVAARPEAAALGPLHAAENLVGVLAGPPELAGRTAGQAGLDWPLLADPEGRFTRLLTAGRPCAALLLDANQRVLEVFEEPQTGAAALARLRGTAPPPGRALQPPPVLLIPDVLDAAQCAALIALWRESHVEGEVGSTDAAGRTLNRTKETRRCRDHTILDMELNRAISRQVARRLAPEIAKAFAFQITNNENYYVVGYEADRGDFFRPHRDNVSPAFAHRRFAVTLSLNAGDYSGGGVRFPEYDPAPIDPPRGGAVVFSCSLLHEAVEVSAGTRFILSNFYWGKAEEAQRLAHLRKTG
jgi:hypothetical protein